MSGMVVVTGGRGFIGGHLVRALEKMGNAVKIVEVDDGAGGILDFELLMRKFMGAKLVFHLGATSGNLYFNYPPLGIKTNCKGTWNVLEAARLAGVRRVLFASTSSLYAFSPLPHKEEHPVADDINLYALTKRFGEATCQMFWRKYGLETVILRLASIYGTEEEKKGNVMNPIHQFIDCMMRGEQPVLFQGGKQTRDLTFVDDVVSAFIHASMSVPPGEIYNVSTGQETSFNDVVDAINKVLGKNIKPIYRNFETSGLQTVYIDRQWVDNSKLQATGWKPTVDLMSGIKRIVDCAHNW